MGSNPRNVSGGVFAPAAESFKLTVKPQGVRFLSRGVQPPSNIYVEAEDDLAVSVASSVVGEAVTFNYRLLRFDGEIIEGQFVVRPASNRAVTKYSESLAEGFLLSMSCQAAAATTRGQTFVRVALTSPAFGGNLPSYMLMADYVTTAMAPAHPNGRVLAPTEGPGNIRTAVAPAVGVGLNISINVPTNARWRLINALASLTADAVVANRQVLWVFTVGGQVVFHGQSPLLQTAGQTVSYNLMPVQVRDTLTKNDAYVAIPPTAYMLAGDGFNCVTSGLDAGDQWNFLNVAVEEWLDNV